MTNILGIEFSNKSAPDTLDYIDNILSLPVIKETTHVVTANPETIMKSKKQKGYKKILKSADLVTPDGIGILLASKILNGKIKGRVTGIDLMTSLFQLRTDKKRELKVYMLGADENTLKKAILFIEKKYPYVKIVGCHHGYFEKKRENRILREIYESKADLLLVGMGSPLQEQFIYNNKEKLRTKVSIGVGGAFDVWGGKVKRAPSFVQQIGLEWLWRLLQNPSRILRQFSLVRFGIAVVRYKLSGK